MKAFANYRSHASGLSSPPLACPSSNSTEWNRRKRERECRVISIRQKDDSFKKILEKIGKNCFSSWFSFFLEKKCTLYSVLNEMSC